MELDDAYAVGAHISGGDAYPGRWLDQARNFCVRMDAEGRARMGLPYGVSARQRFDLFYPEGAAHGLVVFVHGGFWLKLDRSYWSHLAAGPLAHGWAVAMPSYDLCPDVQISDITREIVSAVQVTARMVSGPIALTGHSAGGHLVSRMLAPGILDPEVAARLQHVVPISPLSDLRPLLKTSMNAELGLTEDEAEAESPVNQPRPNTKVTVWIGADERPAFLDQARWLAEAWGAAHVIVPGKHHFDVIDALGEPESDLVGALVGAN